MEAFTGTEEVDEMKRLIKQIEPSTWNYDGALWSLVSSGEWEVLSNSANNIRAISEIQYIDLAGMSQREKTLFIKGLRIDYQFVPSMTDAITGDALNLAFLVTDQPPNQIDFAGPGFGFTTMNAENCALFQQDVWKATVDTAAWSSYLDNTARVQNGMMEATSSDRIYFQAFCIVNTRKIGATTSTLSNVFVPGFRLVLEVDAIEEPEYQYLMRQRRAYELAQSHDED